MTIYKKVKGNPEQMDFLFNHSKNINIRTFERGDKLLEGNYVYDLVIRVDERFEEKVNLCKTLNGLIKING